MPETKIISENAGWQSAQMVKETPYLLVDFYSFPNAVWERNTSTTLLCGAENKVSDWL